MPGSAVFPTFVRRPPSLFIVRSGPNLLRVTLITPFARVNSLAETQSFVVAFGSGGAERGLELRGIVSFSKIVKLRNGANERGGPLFKRRSQKHRHGDTREAQKIDRCERQEIFKG